METRGVIAAIRDGDSVSDASLGGFVKGLADGGVSDAQAGAFAMAVLLKSLAPESRRALTLAMRDSGQILQWRTDRPVLDKHSTGGIGDCISLVLAPALAACGAAVPMISGRGLGHTGGTLDKMEAIPGVSTELETARLQRIVEELGVVIAAASAEIAPADRRLYAVRDVSGTVESVDLITASILSKKLAAGLTGLVLDVKQGSGAFMKDIGAARALAESLVETANAAGCRCSALITDMNQPLASSAGNAVEVAEAMRVLTGTVEGRLAKLTCYLGGEALYHGGLCDSPESGTRQVLNVLKNGQAAEVFGRMLRALGGPVQFVETWQRFLPEATIIREVPAQAPGFVAAIDGEALGHAVIALGGGRKVESDRIDPAVGLSDILPLGAEVIAGQPLLRIHASRAAHADAAEAIIRDAMVIGPAAPAEKPLVIENVGP
ncbi:Thymidine phosphorylase [Roseovarius sp. THAF9]|uniref:thymidine phosphorylase n=1 Tax=Roseovarius sp. THAF9 TaxID=2587847 RepID=UPI001268214D|nr:thymidine phosphorylase [Roseovarius sp. THAF9]QFT94036.1 Thymidine phosphorylase [Roseovarius sp. THAF9]